LITFRLDGGFTEAQLDQIYGETFQVLEEIGVEVGDDEIRQYLGGLPGISVRGTRVCYAPSLVREWIEVIKEDNLEYAYNRKDGRIRMVGPYMGQYYHDPDTDEVRLATGADMSLAVKLCDALDFYGPSPIHLQTVPPPVRQVTTFKICVENSREIGGWGPAATEKDAYWLCQIGEAAGRQPPHCCMEIPISPLRLNHKALRMIYKRRNRDDQLTGMVLGGGVVPMPGATTPIFAPACFIQSMAEALAAYITPQLIDPRVQGYCSFGGKLFDLRRMTPGTMFPETAVYISLVRQVIQRFLGETLASSLAAAGSDNPQATPDSAQATIDSPQATIEMGFRVALDILAGARTFLGVGAYGDGFCPVTAVIEADLVNHFTKFIAGGVYRYEPGISLRTITEALEDKNYLAHPTTLEYRELYLIPELVFRYDTRQELVAAAWEKGQQIVAEHDYALPEDVQRNVTEVYEAACADLLEGK